MFGFYSHSKREKNKREGSKKNKHISLSLSFIVIFKKR